MLRHSFRCLHIPVVALILLSAARANNAQTQEPPAKASSLWYRHPAKDWASEALPIGNGRMGAMLFGGVAQEVVQFNEQSLWSGDNNWDAFECGDGFGAYRNFGRITIDFDGVSADRQPASWPADYRRELDIASGIHTTAFTRNGITFTREAFASHPDQVMVFRYTANKPASLTGRIALSSAQPGETTIIDAEGLLFSGEMPNKLKHACGVRVLHAGGKTRIDADALRFEQCDSLTLLVDARTNYRPDYKAGWRGEGPLPLVERELAKAQAKPYEELRAAHVKDLSGLLGRVALDIGATDPAVLALPTDERLKRYAGGASKPESTANSDPDLEATMFQYGRYLLASCSRPGGLPANLQGLWNDSNTPPWASDYHNNINVQMNYWGAEIDQPAPSAIEPLIDFVVACRRALPHRHPQGIRPRRPAAGPPAPARTFSAATAGSGTSPPARGTPSTCAEHYAFTQDKEFLRKTGLSDGQGDLPVLGGPSEATARRHAWLLPTAGRPSTARARTA